MPPRPSPFARPPTGTFPEPAAILAADSGIIPTASATSSTSATRIAPVPRPNPTAWPAAKSWVKIAGNPPADPGELRYLATDTSTPYLAEYTGTDAGKLAHYWLRWVNTRGEKGPWSDNVSGTIPG